MQDQQALPMPLHRYSYPAATTIPAGLPAQQHSADPAVRRHHHPPEEVITAPSSEITSKRAAPKQASHHRAQSVSRGLNGWQSAFCGSVAGLVSRAVIAPLDVAKITLQLQTQRVKFGLVQSGRPTGMLGCMLRIYREEGIRGLFKGNLSAECLYLTYGGAQFMSYTFFERALRQTDIPSTAQTFLAGACAGAAGTTLTYPFDLLRTRFAAQTISSAYYPGIAKAVAMIWHDEGLAGFYRGVWPANLQIMPYMGLMFASYNAISRGYQVVRARFPAGWRFLDHWQDLLVGGMAGVASKTGVYPLDLIRKRMQVQGPHRARLASGAVPIYRNSVLAVMAAVVRDEGVAALFKGLVPALIKAGPTSAVMFLVYGQTRDLILYLSDKGSEDHRSGHRGDASQ